MTGLLLANCIRSCGHLGRDLADCILMMLNGGM